MFPGEPRGTIQPAIVSFDEKRPRTFVRSTSRIGRVRTSGSNDGRKTWSELKPTELTNPNSGINAVALKAGRIALVYNHTAKGCSPLNLAVSRDGDRWNKFLALESEPGEFSYPDLIHGSDGNVPITHAWNRKSPTPGIGRRYGTCSCLWPGFLNNSAPNSRLPVIANVET